MRDAYKTLKPELIKLEGNESREELVQLVEHMNCMSMAKYSHFLAEFSQLRKLVRDYRPDIEVGQKIATDDLTLNQGDYALEFCDEIEALYELMGE